MNTSVSQKNVVVYFRKKIGGPDPFATWGKKRSVYHNLFRKGEAIGLNMYFIPQPEYYLGGYAFKNPWRYNSRERVFEPTEGMVIADAIYDRSGGLSFPEKGIDTKVLNPWDFKALCADKNATADLLGTFMPKSFRVQNQAELTKHLQNFSETELIVLKPANGFGGKGVVINIKKHLQNIPLQAHADYSLQQFIDTSTGIPGITPSRHDLRVIIVNGNIVMAHIRTPQSGSYLANVAQGGSIREVPLEQLPMYVLEAVRAIQNIIDEPFHLPLYSIDFGISGKRPYVFELNDQIGFPSEDMPGATIFIDQLLSSLLRLASLPNPRDTT